MNKSQMRNNLRQLSEITEELKQSRLQLQDLADKLSSVGKQEASLMYSGLMCSRIPARHLSMALDMCQELHDEIVNRYKIKSFECPCENMCGIEGRNEQ